MSRAMVCLRTLTARVVNQRTMERVIDPLLTDLQLEYDAAVRHGQRWRSRWTLVAGFIAFLKTLTLCVAQQVVAGDRVRTIDDGGALKRAAWISTAAMLMATALLVYPVLARQARQPDILTRHPEILLMLLPQALALSIPIGVTFGVSIGLRGRALSTRVSSRVVAGAFACCLACFVTVAWILPVANQAFRDVTFQVAVERGWFDDSQSDESMPRKGLTEMTLGELAARLSRERAEGAGRLASASVAIAYHQRWALSFASVILALFALVISRHLLSRWKSVLSAVGTIAGYYLLLWIGHSVALQSVIPAVAGAWLPNAMFAVVSLAIFVRTSRSRELWSAIEP